MQTCVCPSESYAGPDERRVVLVHTAADQEATEKHAEKSKPTSSQTTEASQRKKAVTEKGKKIKKDLDKIMNEIDDVLEENAEEFIKSYVQRGGE
ncbi:MAG: ubiquitin-like protein Pup [bacterium]|nr:ubiquitin-like protein Pup [bacterium]